MFMLYLQSFDFNKHHRRRTLPSVFLAVQIDLKVYWIKINYRRFLYNTKQKQKFTDLLTILLISIKNACTRSYVLLRKFKVH